MKQNSPRSNNSEELLWRVVEQGYYLRAFLFINNHAIMRPEITVPIVSPIDVMMNSVFGSIARYCNAAAIKSGYICKPPVKF